MEAGAHIGQDTVEMARVWEKGTIHAFEPVPSLFEQLRRTVIGLPNVKCYKMALSERSGSSKLYVSVGGACGSG